MHPRGSKDVRRANGVSPRVGSSFELPSRLVVSLRVRHWSYPRLNLSCTKGDLMQPQQGKYGCVLGIIPQLGRNRFESSSVLDSENVTRVHFIVVIDGSIGYEI